MSPHSGEMREEDKIEVAKHFLKKCVVKAVEMEEKELVGGKKKQYGKCHFKDAIFSKI